MDVTPQVKKNLTSFNSQATYRFRCHNPTRTPIFLKVKASDFDAALQRAELFALNCNFDIGDVQFFEALPPGHAEIEIAADHSAFAACPALELLPL